MFSKSHLQPEQDEFISNEFGTESDFERLGGLRLLQSSMSMPSAPGSSQGTNSGSQSGTAPAAPDPVEEPNLGEQTNIDEPAPIDPVFSEPEGDEWLPWDVNVDMCTDYTDFYQYTAAQESLQYEYSVQISDTSNTEFVSDLTKIFRQTIHDNFCESNRVLKLGERKLEAGKLIGFQVKEPEIEATSCTVSTETGCFIVVGDIDYAISDEPGNASKEAILNSVLSIVSSYENDNIIKIGEEDEEETSPEDTDTAIDEIVDNIIDQSEMEEEADTPQENAIPFEPQENAIPVEVDLSPETEGTIVASPEGTAAAVPENIKTSELDLSKNTKSIESDDSSNNVVLLVTISCGCSLIALGVALFIHRRRQNFDNDYDSYGDTCIKCVQQEDENVIENSLEDQMGRNTVDARIGSNQGLSTIHIRNTMEDVDLEDVHICRLDPCPTCTRARKVFMTDV